MSAGTAPTGISSGASGLGPGQVVGGRFAVEREVSEDSLGWVLAAADQKTGKPIALRVLTPRLLGAPRAADALREEVRAAAGLTHRSIVATYGVGTDPGGASFVACEWIDGEPLSTIIARRRADGRGGMSLRGSYNVIAHVCKALTMAHAKSAHGAIRPSVVWISRAGRVKVGDFGVARAILRTSGVAGLGPDEQAYLAPEVRTGSAPDARSDIFGLGAVLYVLLTSRSPAEDFVPPSQAHPDASPEIDAVLMRCLAANPADRFATPDEVRNALAPLLANAPAASADDFGIEIDVDVGPAGAVAHAAAPASPAAPARPARPGPPPARPAPRQGSGAGPESPRVGQRVSIHEQFRPPTAGAAQPGAPLSAPTAPGPAAPGAAPSAPLTSAEVDLAGLLAKITENDAPRWMVVKDKLDHGPFSGRELVQMILKGEVLEDNGLLNMDTGERRKVRQFAEFGEFLDQYRMRKQAAAQQAALARSETVETASNWVKVVVGIGVLAMVGGAVGIYFVTRGAGSSTRRTNAELVDMYERGQLQITGTAGILPPPPRRAGGGRRSHGGGGGGGLSYEDAMNQAVNLGDATRGGSERQLTPADVQGVMNGRINSLFSCVSQEIHRGGSLGTVRLDMAIAGSGQVQGVSVNTGSGAFQSCITGKVRAIRFPAFPAPRMGARFSFSVD